MTHEEELYDLLKSAGTSTGDNEDKSTVGVTHLYDDPEDRPPPGESHSKWGDRGPTLDGHPQADHASNGAWAEHKKERQGVLNNLFNSRPSAAAADQKLISENFARGASGDFNSHSVQLQGKSVEKISHPRAATLQQQVRRLLDR